MPVKKNFKNLNPALSFIDSGVFENNTDTSTDMHTHTYQYTPADADTSTDTDEYTHTYISDAAAAQPPLNYTHQYTHTKREAKSRRLQLLIKPSVHAAISSLAGENETSVNDTINTILEEYLKGEGR